MERGEARLAPRGKLAQSWRSGDFLQQGDAEEEEAERQVGSGFLVLGKEFTQGNGASAFRHRRVGLTPHPSPQLSRRRVWCGGPICREE